MNADTLVALAEQCEAASGPDRELDSLIANLCMVGDVESDDGDFWIGRFDEMPVRVPDFTASLDAAMSLVPEGWAVEIMAWPGCAPRVHLLSCHQDGSRWLHSGAAPYISLAAATSALALTAACLKARAHSLRGEGE